ncbi:MAG: hypothetical protein HKN48_09840 [Flavobacteriaceae bacterium]|nr:hypothetical protein [Flavobacteriaceae bacterium]
MKQIIFILFLCVTTAYGQGEERIKAFKRAHITDALSLTASEAEKFWPIYNVHEERMTELRRKERREVRSIVNGDPQNMTDEQANAIIEKGLAFQATELEYSRELIQNLRSAIPPRKIVRLHRAEEEFKKILLERMKNKRMRRN